MGLRRHLPPPPFVSSGCKNLQHGQMLKELMQTPNFRVTVVPEADTVEICGALKVGAPLAAVLWGSAGDLSPLDAALRLAETVGQRLDVGGSCGRVLFGCLEGR